ncbi:hypothetical protein K432DRAFT_160090 [Lepidopterella palustris CBS 459.81]|uniref:Uncharacterized protein n=1 Tax=Lepidopterella palustris CBS 459.81 TaxID=1314670 RepID=A0A8E2E1Y4_9PEZI|nr:hypothetical protein K432DRAFT_160090 [Lepidopterella palustris CBS 459.81]
MADEPKPELSREGISILSQQLRKMDAISSSPFDCSAAITTLRAYAVSILHGDLYRQISGEDLRNMIKVLDADKIFRLAKIAWKFDAKMQPGCSQELVKFVSGVHNQENSIRMQIWTASGYSVKNGPNYESFPAFTSKLEELSEACRKLILEHSVAYSVNADQNQRSAELAALMENF